MFMLKIHLPGRHDIPKKRHEKEGKKYKKWIILCIFKWRKTIQHSSDYKTSYLAILKFLIFFVGRPEPRPTWIHRNFNFFIFGIVVCFKFSSHVLLKNDYFLSILKYTRVSQITGRHYTAVITIKSVKSFVNKVENQYFCEWNLTLIDKWLYAFYGYNGSIKNPI